MFKLSDFLFMETQFPRGEQIVLDFDTYHLSIVRNSMSIGNESGLYEICVFNAKGGLANDVVKLENIGNDEFGIKGNLTEAEVDAIIMSICDLTKTSPIQV
jgi:hypothetical protein